MEVWMVAPANSSSEGIFFHLETAYSVVTIFCNLFLIAVILSKAELRGQVERILLSLRHVKHVNLLLQMRTRLQFIYFQRDSFFMVSLSIANVLVGFAFTSKILRDEDTDSWPHLKDYIEVCHAVKGLVVFSLAASIYNFVAIAFERWLMLRWEMQRWEEVEEVDLLNKRLVMGIVWGLSLCQVGSPTGKPIYCQALPVWTSNAINNSGVEECTFREMDEKWLIVALVTILIIPSLLLVLLHGLLLRQVVAESTDLVVFYQFRLLSVITGVFMFCWWPVIAYLFASTIDPSLSIDSIDSVAAFWVQVNLSR